MESGLKVIQSESRAIHSLECKSDPPLNILILNQTLPVFPGPGGHEYLNAIHLAEFASHLGMVSMVHTAEDLAKSQEFVKRGIELYLWESPHIKNPPFFPRRPSSPAILSRKISRGIQTLHSLMIGFPEDALTTRLGYRNLSGSLWNALAKRHWQVCIVIQSSLAHAIDYFPSPPVSVLMMHDIRSLLYERQSQVAESAVQKRHLQRQAQLYYKFEQKYLQKYDLVVALSQVDYEWIRKHYQPRNLALIPIPVDAQYFSNAGRESEKPSRIVFPGLMNHPPNSDAAIYFAREVFPLLRERLSEAEFYIVGKDPTDAVQALGKIPGVTVTGAVPDARPFLESATAVVVPLRFGSGVRQKILEAWAMEKFIVSTSVGAEGLEYRDGVHLVIADSRENMVQVLLRALQEPAYRQQIQREGRQVAVLQHDPRKIARGYYDAILRVGVANRNKVHEPMQVAMDLRWMIPGKAGGLEDLARSFVEQLLLLDRQNYYTFVLPNACRYDFDLRNRANVKTVCLDSPAASLQRRFWKGWQAIQRNLNMDSWESPMVLEFRKLVNLGAHLSLSFPGYINPDFYPVRNVLIVPDIQHEYMPQFFSPEDLEERRRIYGDSIRRADHLCAISEFTRKTLIETYHLAPERISTTLLAANPIFAPATDTEADEVIRNKYGLPENYLFFPGHTWHHKNHLAVLDALVILRRKHGINPALVCTGGAREAQTAIEKKIQEEGLQAQVRFLGYIPKRQMPALYRRASCLVFPSYFEGFGMPVLEAMACGCPVVASNRTSLPEIAGEAALYTDPCHPEGMADAVFRLFKDIDLRCELVQAGIEQSLKFSWRKFALEILAVLRQIHSRYHRLEG